jgi:peptidoglycan/LPS O-acetylase OafA/YrhL
VKGERRLDVQGLRALAILFVVGFHGDFGLSSGFVGVDVFFAISGFVITDVLLRRLTRTDSVGLVAFYARRVKRILPALAVMVTLVVTLGIYFAPVGALHITSLTAMAAAVFGSKWYAAYLPDGYFAVSSATDPLLHTWSLGVEEQFYLGYPILLLLAWLVGRRLRAPRATAIALVAATMVASFGLAVWWWAHDSTVAFYASPARAWEFGAGALTALLAPTWSRLTESRATTLAALALPPLLAASVSVTPTGPVGLAVPVLATCVLMAAGARTNLVSRILGARPLVVIGDLSYSLYLWHWPLIVFGRALFPTATLAAPVAALLSITPAVLSYRWIESPIRHGTFNGRAVVALAAACVAVPAGAAVGVSSASLVTRGFYSDVGHLDLTRGCDAPTPLGANRPQCTFSVRQAKGTVVLIGDSNAGQFTEPIVRAANRLGLDVRVATFSSCPFVPLHLSNRGRKGAECEEHNAKSLAALEAIRPGLVVTASRTDSWINDRANRLGRPLTASTSAKARLYEEALRRVVRTLNAAAIPVVVVHPIPLVSLDASGCAWLLVATGGCTGSVARSAIDNELARTLTVEERALAGASTAWLLDLEDDLCARTTCSVRRNGLLLYRNANHLNVKGSLTLTDRFLEVIAAHVRRGPPSEGGALSR